MDAAQWPNRTSIISTIIATVTIIVAVTLAFASKQNADEVQKLIELNDGPVRSQLEIITKQLSRIEDKLDVQRKIN